MHGILLAKKAKVNALTVIGDSMVVIKSMLGKFTPLNSKLAVTIAQIKKEASSFIKSSYYHVKRDLNPMAELWANKTLNLALGSI